MFVGPTGTGKSVYVQDKLMHDLPKEKFLPAFVNFSAQTSANQTQVSEITLNFILNSSRKIWQFIFLFGE